MTKTYVCVRCYKTSELDDVTFGSRPTCPRTPQDSILKCAGFLLEIAVPEEAARAAEAMKQTGVSLVKEQAAPVGNDKPATWDLVMADFKARDGEGRRKYGTPLQPFNGRSNLIDAYQEALDMVVYLRNEIYERTGK